MGGDNSHSSFVDRPAGEGELLFCGGGSTAWGRGGTEVTVGDAAKGSNESSKFEGEQEEEGWGGAASYGEGTGDREVPFLSLDGEGGGEGDVEIFSDDDLL